MSLGRATIASPADTDKPSIALTADLAASIAGMHSLSGPVRIDAAAGAFVDLWGNPSVAMANLAPVVVPDSAGPVRDPRHPPVLDLADGTIHMWLDEYVDRSLTDPSLLEIVVEAGTGGSGGGAGPAGNGSVSITPARAANGSSGGGSGGGVGDHALLALLPPQKALVQAALNADPSSRIVLNAEAGAFADAAGNPSAEMRGVPVSVGDDDRPPRLAAAAGQSPLLNLSDGTVSFLFDEHVSVPATRPYAISIADPAGENQTRLAGAAVPGQHFSSDLVTLLLTPEQVGAAARLAAQAGGTVRIDAAEGAFADLSGNAFAGRHNLSASLAADTRPPQLLAGAAGHRLDLGRAELVLGVRRVRRRAGSRRVRHKPGRAGQPGARTSRGRRSRVGRAGAERSHTSHSRAGILSDMGLLPLLRARSPPAYRTCQAWWILPGTGLQAASSLPDST